MKRLHLLLASAVLAIAPVADVALADSSMDDNRNYITIYYTDATRTVEAGREGIECDHVAFSHGAKTAYSLTIDLECIAPVGYDEF